MIYSKEIYWEVISTYSRLMREQCDSFFTVRGKESQFIDAANLIHEVAAKAPEFVEVQFQGADRYHYPSPCDLSHPTAVSRWKLHEDNKRLHQHVAQQEIYMDKFRALGLEDSEIAMNPEVSIASWFRLLHLESPSEKVIKEGLEEIRNPRLLSLINSVGYNTKKILRWRREIEF